MIDDPEAGRDRRRFFRELASGIACRLLRSGYGVVLAETDRPLAVRRLVCFCEAVHAGACRVEDVPGRLVPAPEAAFNTSLSDSPSTYAMVK